MAAGQRLRDVMALQVPARRLTAAARPAAPPARRGVNLSAPPHSRNVRRLPA